MTRLLDVARRVPAAWQVLRGRSFTCPVPTGKQVLPPVVTTTAPHYAYIRPIDMDRWIIRGNTWFN